MNLLITGAGGAATPTLVHLLKEKGRYNPILADMKLTPIIRSQNVPSIEIPGADSKDFLPVISEIVNKYQIEAILPGVDEELLPLLKYYSSVDVPYIVAPKEEIVKLALNKYALNRILHKNGITVPYSWHISDFDNIDEKYLEKPLIAKPVSGRGSRGIYFSNSVEEAKSLAKYLLLIQPDTIFQELIKGVEYTISMVCSKTGEVLGIVPKRINSKRGITIDAITEKNSIIDQYCRQIQNVLSATGPMNIQLILSEEGIPYVFEINPRMSTTTILTMMADFNEIDISISDHFDKELGPLNWKEGIRLFRAWNNSFSSNNDD